MPVFIVDSVNVFFVLILVVIGVALIVIARKKGYNPVVWFFTNWLGLIVLFYLENVNMFPEENREAKRRRGNTIGAILVLANIIIVPAIMSAVIFPVINHNIIQTQLTAVGCRGKDLYDSITGANAERIPIGLETIWPKTGKMIADGEKTIEWTFENSSDYFWTLYDGENIGTSNWKPYVADFDFSKLAGPGVPIWEGTRRLTAANNMWVIAANVTDDIPDCIPVIISRNVDLASLIPAEGNLKRQYIRQSSEFLTPFGGRRFIIIQKGGGILTFQGNYATLYAIYRDEYPQKVRDALQKVKYLAP